MVSRVRSRRCRLDRWGFQSHGVSVKEESLELLSRQWILRYSFKVSAAKASIEAMTLLIYLRLGTFNNILSVERDHTESDRRAALPAIVNPFQIPIEKPLKIIGVAPEKFDSDLLRVSATIWRNIVDLRFVEISPFLSVMNSQPGREEYQGCSILKMTDVIQELTIYSSIWPL